VILYLRSLGSDLLHHHGKVGASRELVDVLIDISSLGIQRYTGGQSDDKSGKSHNLALTSWKQAVILRRNALQSKR
jgi:hypothetical protein